MQLIKHFKLKERLSGGLGFRDDTQDAAVVVVVAVVVGSTSNRCCTFEPVVSCVVSELVRVRERLGITLFSSFSCAFTSARAAQIMIGSMINADASQASSETMRDTSGVRYLGEEM
uniref:Uncharacterized protein n=1 Tax=Anopheles merus TaxID=30066 RepID=A0A182V3W7_ANOME